MTAHAALITGITGQDGSYLAELLLEKGYQVWGLIRRSSEPNTGRIQHLESNPKLKLVYGDLTDSTSICQLLRQIKEDNPEMTRLEIYNLGAMSHVKISFDNPEYTGNVDGLGVVRILEAVRTLGLEKVTRFYQASTSELFGKVQEIPQSEKTPFYPRSPYGVAKLYGYWITRNYRESYGMYACTGIIFNHESVRRGENFVTRKVTLGLRDILAGKTDRLYLGNLDAKRDWSHAKDMVEAMWLMLQADQPEDYVVSSDETHSVREFVEQTFARRGFDIKWKGEGVEEIGYDAHTGRELILVSPQFFRPAEVDLLLGDSTRIRTELGWKPRYSFTDLVEEMVEADVPLRL